MNKNSLEGEKILFLSPKYMNIYKDVISCIKELGGEVSWVSSDLISPNPYLVSIKNRLNEENINKFNEKCELFWKDLFSQKEYNKKYDYFFTIDGLMICPFLFKELSTRNPDVKKVLFLYDKNDGMQEINSTYHYYDAIYTFDLGDRDKYHLKFMPIYWVPSDSVNNIKYDIFGFASYNSRKPDRTKLFNEVNKICKAKGLSTFVKLYYPMKNRMVFCLKNIIHYLFNHKSYTPLSYIKEGLITGQSLSPDDFRQTIRESRVILDTQAPYQDGLTARFMWALGEGKKIITTNSSITRYPFYDPKQFYILHDIDVDELLNFIVEPFVVLEDNKLMIEQYRIDNWIVKMLCD